MINQLYNPEIQTRLHGPLTPDFQKRILAIKQKHCLTYGDVAERAGCSGSFVGNITRYGNNVGTPTANRLAAVVGKLEATPKGNAVVSLVPDPGTDTSGQTPEPATLENRLLGNLEAVTRFAATRFGVGVSEIEVRIIIRPPPLAA